MVLEANALARKVGRPIAIASFLLAVIPFFSVELGVMVAVPSLFAASSNLLEGWVAHALGERQYFELMQHAASKLAPRGLHGTSFVRRLYADLAISELPAVSA